MPVIRGGALSKFSQVPESKGVVNGGACGCDNPIVTGDLPFSLDAAKNPHCDGMEGKNCGCQSAYQVSPIVAAGHMSQFVKQDVVEFRLSNLRQQGLGENDNRVHESRGQR